MGGCARACAWAFGVCCADEKADMSQTSSSTCLCASGGGGAPRGSGLEVGEASCPPGRCVQVRKVAQDAAESDLERLLGSFGEVVRWERARRGAEVEEEEEVVLVYYQDLRAAEAAVLGIEGQFLSGKILSAKSRADEEGDEHGRVVVRVEAHLGEQELFHIFSTYGDVRTVQSVEGCEVEKVIEFFDLRDAEKVVQALKGAGGEGSAARRVEVEGNVGLPGRETDEDLRKKGIRENGVGGSGGGGHVVQDPGYTAGGYGDVPSHEYGFMGEMMMGGLPLLQQQQQQQNWVGELGHWPVCGPITEMEGGIKASDSASSFVQRSKDCWGMPQQVQSLVGVWGGSDSTDSRGSGTPTGPSTEGRGGSAGSHPSDGLLSGLPWISVDATHISSGIPSESQLLQMPRTATGTGLYRNASVSTSIPSAHHFECQEDPWRQGHSLSRAGTDENAVVEEQPTQVGDKDSKESALDASIYDLEHGSSTEASGDFNIGVDEDPNHLLPPDLHTCMNSDKEYSRHSCHDSVKYSQFSDPRYSLTGPSFGMAAACWSPHNGFGLGPHAARYTGPTSYEINMSDGNAGTETVLNQYYDSLNQTALLQQAVGREVLKRLANIAVNGPVGVGECSPGNPSMVECIHQKTNRGNFGGAGWGAAEKNARRRGSRYGRKTAVADPTVDIERRAQQERMFALDLKRIRDGNDKRTTLMIKNIPNKYTQKMLLLTIEEECKGTFDFFYLPIDFKNRCNVGYGFINMVRPEQILPFVEKFNEKRWEKFNSEKVCCITYARIQGRAALINHFQNSSLMQEDSKHRPLLFTSDGQPEIFPPQMVA